MRGPDGTQLRLSIMVAEEMTARSCDIEFLSLQVQLSSTLLYFIFFVTPTHAHSAAAAAAAG